MREQTIGKESWGGGTARKGSRVGVWTTLQPLKERHTWDQARRVGMGGKGRGAITTTTTTTTVIVIIIGLTPPSATTQE